MSNAMPGYLEVVDCNVIGDEHLLDTPRERVLTGDAPMSGIPAWSRLFRTLRARTQWSWITSITDDDLRSALAAPVTLAAWIDQFAPELRQAGRIEVAVVVGPNGLEAMDSGAWFQVVPMLLGNESLTIDVTLLSDDTKPTAQAVGCPLRPARVVAGGVTNWVPGYGTARPDLVAVFLPSLADSPSRLLEADALGTFCKQGARLALAAASLESAEKDEWTVQIYGLGMVGTRADNPYRIRASLADSEVSQAYTTVAGIDPPLWGAVLWEAHVWQKLDAAVAADRMQTLQSYDEYLAYTCEQDEMYPERGWLGQPLFSLDGHVLVGLPVRLLADLVTGVIYAIKPKEGEEHELVAGEEHELVALDFGRSVLEAAIRDNYPGDGDLAFERALWSVEAATAVEDRLRESEPFQIATNGDLCEPLAAGVDAPAANLKVHHMPTPGGRVIFDALALGDDATAWEKIRNNPTLVDATDDRGQTPIFYVLHGTCEPVGFLLERGASITHTTNNGYSVIHEAGKRGSVEVVDLLIEKQVDVNQEGPLGWTPALLAAVTGNYKVLRRLLLAGAYTTPTHESGLCLLDLAAGGYLPADVVELIAGSR